MTTERIEFVDAVGSGGGDDDVVELGGPGDDDGGRSGGRVRLVLVGVVVVAVLAALLVGRFAGGDDGGPTAAATPSAVARSTQPVTTPVFGVVGLPRAIGSPNELVTTGSGDVVWMVDHGAGIVRIENGVVTARQLLESQVSSIAVDPSGDRLYVATTASRPGIQVLDGTTLALGRSRPIDGTIQDMAVTIDAIWAASGSQLARLDLDSLQPLATLDLPGVVVTQHLRISTEQDSGNQQVLTGLVTGSEGDAPTVTRVLRVNPLTQQVTFGPDLPTDTQIAVAPLLTWLSYRPGGGPVRTVGYTSAVAETFAAEADPPLATGSRIYDGGGFAAFFVVAPDSSVIGCRDPGGFPTSEVDVAPSVPDAVITGQVLRTGAAFYVVTDRGLVRSGVGDCR